MPKDPPVTTPLAQTPASRARRKAIPRPAPIQTAPISAPVDAPIDTVPPASDSPALPSPRSPLFFPETPMSSLPTFDFTAPFQTAFADLQEKTKAAFEKSTSAFGDYNDFAKGNVEAFVEAGKILASGLQALTTTLVSDGRAGFETLTAEVKELATAKSPTDFLKLQNDLVKKHFDEAVSTASKHSEALVKLANEAAQPISSRVSLAVEKVKSAA